jgi:alpha-amylase/alpha-mannosidase (GH57 family)
MSDKLPLNVVLYWHMHQPEYRDHRTGKYFLPWTYLHVIKDYVDMAAHLEAHPDAKAVVNFTPTLLEQIDNYNHQLKKYLEKGSALNDPMLEALVSPVLPESPEQRHELIRHCLRANEDRLINRFEPYKHLASIAGWLDKQPHSIIYIDDQYLIDLLVWFHLAWLGETVRRTNPRIKELMAKATGYTVHDRNDLVRIIAELSADIIGRYKTLAERGQIELSMTPYAHPIIPLLIDIESATEAMPDALLPHCRHYPDGVNRTHWHIDKGIEVFKKYFGVTPRGCWPSEGSISEATLQLLAERGFEWAASGETVMHNSIHKSGEYIDCVHRGYRYKKADIACFFRDDGLSDLIGFNYSEWHADDAAANLVHHLENIAGACKGNNNATVSIILDGENAWEYYPENGYYFLDSMYRALLQCPDIRLTTYSEILSGKPELTSLSHVVAGSWVYGTFSTWIGEPDKNHAWDLLCDAKKAFDNVISSGKLDTKQRAHAEKQLAICEGSDWFWWFGDYNPADSVKDFDHLYRLQLFNLYMLLGMDPPDNLGAVISHGTGAPVRGGAMRRGTDQA